MISNALQFITDALDQFLRNRYALDESKVALNALVDSTGAVPLANQNKIVISLLNIEKETARPYYIRNQRMANGHYSDFTLSEKYNLDVMMSSNFDNYSETLKFLQATIGFFQVNTCLDATSFSSIPAKVARVEMDIERISYHQMHNLWTAMGAKYQPSVIYRMRLVTIQGDEPTGYVPAVSNLLNQVNPV